MNYLSHVSTHYLVVIIPHLTGIPISYDSLLIISPSKSGCFRGAAFRNVAEKTLSRESERRISWLISSSARRYPELSF